MEIKPCSVDGNGRKPGSGGTKDINSPEEGGIFEDDGIASLQEKRCQQRNRLLRARRHENLLRFGTQSTLRIAIGNVLPEPGQSLRRITIFVQQWCDLLRLKGAQGCVEPRRPGRSAGRQIDGDLHIAEIRINHRAAR